MTLSVLNPRIGIDFAFANPKPTPAQLVAANVTFVCRYLSLDPAKNITAAEYAAYQSDRLDVVLVWETTANRMLDGEAAGDEDAQRAHEQTIQLGIPRFVPTYFACDFDATPADQVAIDAYLTGAGHFMDKGLIGMYGGFWPLSRAFNAGLITYGWQTFAWSGGNWDARAQLRQVQNGVTVAGVDADIDHAVADNFGQVGFSIPKPPVPVTGTQTGWRHCDKCQSLYWEPGLSASKCAAGGTHMTLTSEHVYTLTWSNP